MAFTASSEAVDAAVDSVTVKVNDGYLRIYDGTRPDFPDDPLSGNTQLAELRYGNPAFGTAVDGVATANLISSDTSADDTGLATFWRSFKSDGVSPIMDGSAGGPGSGADLILNNPNIQVGATVSVSTFVWSLPKG